MNIENFLKNGSRLWPWALAIVLSSCQSALTAPCRISSESLAAYEAIIPGSELKLGEIYRFDGIYYEEYHGSGLIAETYADAETLSIQKYGAFCVRIAESCGSALTPGKRVNRLTTGEAIASFSGLVRFESRERRDVDPGGNQCLAGTLLVEKVVAVQWQ